MKKYLKGSISLTLLVLALSISPQCAKALPSPCVDPDAYCPIDGGVSILIAAGVALGLKKYREERKKKISKLP